MRSVVYWPWSATVRPSGRRRPLAKGVLRVLSSLLGCVLGLFSVGAENTLLCPEETVRFHVSVRPVAF